MAVECLFDPMTMDAEVDDIEDIAQNVPENVRNAMTQTEVSTTTVGIQTKEIQSKPCSPDFDEAFFAGNDEKVKFYTGLPSFEILQKVFSFVEPQVDRRPKVLSTFQKFAKVLVKLRLAVPHLDLAYRLKISSSMVSRILFTWLTVMDIR